MRRVQQDHRELELSLGASISVHRLSSYGIRMKPRRSQGGVRTFAGTPEGVRASLTRLRGVLYGVHIPWRLSRVRGSMKEAANCDGLLETRGRPKPYLTSRPWPLLRQGNWKW